MCYNLNIDATRFRACLFDSASQGPKGERGGDSCVDFEGCAHLLRTFPAPFCTFPEINVSGTPKKFRIYSHLRRNQLLKLINNS